MCRTAAVIAMMRSYSVLVLLVAVAFVSGLPVSGNSIEREATVELLPSDLIQADELQAETIANPVQVIEKHVMSTWRSIVKQILDETRPGLKHKRTVGKKIPMMQVVGLLNIVNFMMLSGTMPGIGMNAIPSHVSAPVALNSASSALAGTSVPGVGNLHVPGASPSLPATALGTATNMAGVNHPAVAAATIASSMAPSMVMGNVPIHSVSNSVSSMGGPSLPASSVVPGMGAVGGVPSMGNGLPGVPAVSGNNIVPHQVSQAGGYGLANSPLANPAQAVGSVGGMAPVGGLSPL